MEDNKRMSETSDAANIEINRHTFVDKPTKKYVTGRRAKSFSDQLSNQKKNLFKFAFRNNFLKRKKVKNKFTSRGQSYWEKFNSTLVIPQKSFELQALETLFTVIISLEVQEVQALKEDSEDILNLMKKSPLLGVQTEEKLRLLKDSLSSLSDRIISCVKMIEEITDDDEEMSLMNLTTLRQDPMLYRVPLRPEILSKHEEVEEMLEAYLLDYASLEQKIKYISNKIAGSEDLLGISLEMSRNQIEKVQTCLLLLMNCLSFGTFVSGSFSMNVYISFATKDYSFVTVCVAVAVSTVVGYFSYYLYFIWADVFPEEISLKKK